MRHIRNVDAEHIAGLCHLKGDGVVQILGVGTVDGENDLVTQIEPSVGYDGLFRFLLRFVNDPLGESTVLGPGDWKVADKPENGVPAIIADGPQAGTKITIQRPKASEEAAPKPSKTLAERKAAKEKQRKRRTIEKLMDFLKSDECKTPKRGTLYLLMACKGVSSICGGRFNYASKTTVDPTGLPDKITSITALKERSDIDTLVWKRVLENIVNELNNGQSGPGEPGWDAAELLSEITGFNLDSAFEEAVGELPDPKAWEAMAKAEEKAEKETEKEAA